MVTTKKAPAEHHLISDEVYVNTTKSSVSNGVLVFVLLLSLIMNALCLYFVMGYSLSLTPQTDDSFGIKKALLEMEYEKVGGKKNYDVLQQYSQMQIKEQISQIEQYVKWGGTKQQDTQTPSKQGSLTPDEIKTIVSDASLEGNKDASVVVIEYSDMECPFCMRQYHDTKLFPTVATDYKDQVALAFKNNRGVNHKGTEAKALAALCALNVGGDSAYQKFYKSVMDKSTNEGGVLDVTKLPEIAKSLGIDQKKWQTCVDNKESLSRFSAQTQEAQKFGLSGTPGTLIINVKTGKYATVEWAYPYETFKAKIDELLK